MIRYWAIYAECATSVCAYLSLNAVDFPRKNFPFNSLPFHKAFPLFLAPWRLLFSIKQTDSDKNFPVLHWISQKFHWDFFSLLIYFLFFMFFVLERISKIQFQSVDGMKSFSRNRKEEKTHQKFYRTCWTNQICSIISNYYFEKHYFF